MTAPNRRAALGALDRVRPYVDNLHRNRPSEELAADLTMAWEQTEVVLRALLGGTSLTGQQLVRELRQREMVSLEQAHALLNFHAARDRAGLPGYQVAAGDVTAARDAVAELDMMLGGVPSLAATSTMAAAPSPYAPGNTGPRPAAGAGAFPPPPGPAPVGAAAPPVAPAGGSRLGRRWRGIPVGLLLALAALLLVLLPLGGWWVYANRPGSARSLATAERLYANGDKAGARLAFAEIARERPDLALPHVYLGRIAREQGDVAVAQEELQLAIRAEPNNAVAQREMGSLMLATNNPDLARRFYTRALELNPNDRIAAGYLGCALARLGQMQLAQNFISRAGPGDWQACLTQQTLPGMMPPGMMPPPGAVPPGAVPPGGYPPPAGGYPPPPR